MKTFYVTFMANTVFRNYYAEFQAYDAEILKVYLDNHCPKVWAQAYTTPKELKNHSMVKLNDTPEMLFYRTVEAVSK